MLIVKAFSFLMKVLVGRPGIKGRNYGIILFAGDARVPVRVEDRPRFTGPG